MAELNVVVCVAFDHRANAEGLERFKNCICHCGFVEMAMEVSGTFDMIVQGKIETLSAYTDQMDRIRPQLAEFVTRIETNFVSKKIERHSVQEKCIWVPCVGGRKRIEIGMIDKVVAEGDYMRLFIHDWHCLIHSTIHALKDRFYRPAAAPGPSLDCAPPRWIATARRQKSRFRSARPHGS